MPNHPTRTVAPPELPTLDRPADLLTPDADGVTAGMPGEEGDRRPPVAPPGYELLEEIGSGGMGVVYRARELALNRHVAVKVLQDRFPADGVAATRFVEEAQITGQLQHPGIPPIHQVGTLHDGRPFLVMKLIKGRTLEDDLKDRAEPSDDRGRLLAVFEQICQAVACAHDRKVIHRDLKPANVMVGAFGEVQVMDWGLAKLLTAAGTVTEVVLAEPRPMATEIRTLRDSDGSFTQAGSVLGTPAFMPPEQAGGEIDRIDERADVFGLGAILCVILTGKPVYIGKDSETVRLMAIRCQSDECMVRLDACGAEPALLSLCKRCLATVPSDRPRNAGEVAKAVAGLRAEAEDRAKQAELDRAAAEVRTAEQHKRRKVQAALGLSFTALVVLVGAFAWWQDRQATERRTELAAIESDRIREQAAVEGRAQQAVESAVTLSAELRDKFRFTEAAVTLDQADALIPPDASPQIRDRLAAARKDLAFVRQLDEIRTSRVRLDFYTGQAGIQRSYPAAFRDIGIDPTGPDSAAIGDRVAASPIKQHLVIALDDWSWNESNITTRARLLAVVRRADPGPWSDRLRDSAVRAQPAALDRLAAEANPDTIPANLAVLLFQIRPQAWADGPKLLASAVSRYPNDFWVQFEAGFYYYAKDYRWAVAAGYFRAAYTLRPDLPLVRQLLLDCAIRAGQEVEATAELQELIRRDPKTAWPHAELAKALRRNDVKAAIVEHKEAIRLDPKNPSFHQELAWTLRISDPEGAIAEYKEAIRLRPTYANFHAELAQILGTKNPKAAIAEFKEAIRLDPSNGRWPEWIAFLLMETGDPKGAAIAARESIRLDSRNPRSYYHLGRGLQATGDLDGAIAAFRETIRLDPNQTGVRNTLNNAIKFKAARDAKEGRVAPPPREVMRP